MPDYRESDVPDQSGKTILVTGANTGIGYDAARVLAQRGARVLLGCRSEEKAVEAIDKIKGLHADADVSWVPLDLASLKSIAAAADIVKQESRLDALVNNAGVMVPPKMETEDGFELQFGVNHLGHFALTGHLIDMLKDQPGARIVNVSSLAHKNGRIIYDDIPATKNYNRMERYSMSKFANILFTHELQRRLEAAGSPAISVACHPGGSMTELGRHIPPLLAVLFLPLSLIMNSSAEGALPTLLATTGADVQGGDYYGPMRMGEMRHSAHKVDTIPASKDTEDARKLWDISTELTGVSYLN
jgi:NAD(P)-dependent dehydrogenase (short-subunit alcohol dehydrogenase family)